MCAANITHPEGSDSCSCAERANLHGLPENAAYEGLPPVQTALGLKHVHELTLAYAAVRGSCFCSFLCPIGCCHAAITPKDKPLQARENIRDAIQAMYKEKLRVYLGFPEAFIAHRQEGTMPR